MYPGISLAYIQIKKLGVTCPAIGKTIRLINSQTFMNSLQPLSTPQSMGRNENLRFNLLNQLRPSGKAFKPSIHI